MPECQYFQRKKRKRKEYFLSRNKGLPNQMISCDCSSQLCKIHKLKVCKGILCDQIAKHEGDIVQSAYHRMTMQSQWMNVLIHKTHYIFLH